MTISSDDRELSKLIFDHALARLQTQRQDILTIRNQASISAAVTGLIATVFATVIGSEELASSIKGVVFLGFSLEALLLIFCFGASIGLSALVVVHWSDFTFSFDVKRMHEELEARGADGFLSLYVGDAEYYFLQNEVRIQQAHSKLLFAMIFGWAQIAPWLMLT